MKSKNQTIDVDEEERFDDLIKLYKDIKKFKEDESADILSNFHVKDFKVRCGNDPPKPYQKFQLNKLVDRDYELQLNLSSTAVCAYVLSQYSDIWDDEKSKGRLGKITKYYEFIIDGLEKCTSDMTCIALPDNCKKPSTDPETELEPIDEFSLLNILSLLKNIKDENAIEIDDEEDILKFLDGLEGISSPVYPPWGMRFSGFWDKVDDKKRGIVQRKIILGIIRILCKQFVIKEIPGLGESKEKHPFIFYKFLLMARDWNDDIYNDIIKDDEKWKDINTGEEDKLENFVNGVKGRGDVFEYFFDEIYYDTKYELYRQLSLYQASDFSLFDVKRLIYALLVVKLNDRHSNNLIIKKVLDLIFEFQCETTGLWPICHGVNSDFYIKDGKVKEEYKEGVIISGSPVLSSVECLSDMLGHEDLELDDEYYEKLKVTYDWILNRIIKEGKTKIGWYPEYERDRTPKSWTTGHTLIFLKRYCEKISGLIEKEASKSVSAEDSADFKKGWGDLMESYGLKEIIKKYTIDEIDRRGDSKYRSMVLFGPPGTGKSTVGKALAKELEWGYVELTPGLFLDEGNDKIISKLNRIFKRLVKLKKTVIFFDEVDQLVEKREGKQSSWIVTSILPELQKLRDQKDIIFILATNHVEKVDDAIMRLGRIDMVLPMGVICWRDRLRMLEKKIEWAKKDKEASTKGTCKKIEKQLLDLPSGFDESDLSSELISYLNKTTFMPFVQIDRTLEEIFRETFPDCYDIFFAIDHGHKSLESEHSEFEEFVCPEDKNKKPDILQYSRLPTWEGEDGIEKYIKGNVPQYNGKS